MAAAQAGRPQAATRAEDRALRAANTPMSAGEPLADVCTGAAVVRTKGDLINKAACRRYIFDYAKATRYHEFGRIEPCVFDELNGVLRKHMRHVVARNPSCGRTIR